MESGPVIIQPPTPLVYNDSIDTTSMTNVLLIDSTIIDNNELYDSANANTFPIIYSYNSKTDDLLTLLRQKFPAFSIQRIAVVFHDRGTNCMVPFMNNKTLFEESDLIENQTSFTENVSFLIGCIKEFNVANIDFLACNTLKYSNWKSYYSFLASQTSVVVGASNDATGNVQYGGDWIMESTGQDIKQTYFTDSIDYYKYLLDTYTLNSIVYTFTPGTPTASVTGFVVDITTANIPNTIDISSNIYNVTSIADNAFNGCTTLNSVTIPNSVETIGDFACAYCGQLTTATIGNSVISIGIVAFADCTKLASVTIGNSVKTIGSDAFRNCDFTSINIPNSVETIEDSAFSACTKLTSVILPTNVLFITISPAVFNSCLALTYVFIPNSVTTIGGFAFTDCRSLTSIIIPSSVASIGDNAFRGCEILTAFVVDASNNNYSNNADGVLFNKLKTSLIQYPIGNTRTTYTIPSSVESIGNNAFFGCIKLTSISIPNSVTTIGILAFYACTSLTGLSIGNSVATIEISACQLCSSLTGLSIPSSVATIGDNAFLNCSNLNIVYFLQTSSIPTIGTDAFTDISEFSVGKYYSGVANLSSIEPPVFYSISPIGNNIYILDNIIYTFTTGTLTASVTGFVPGIMTANIPSTIDTSGNTYNVTSIAASAFNNCTTLTSVSIPISVTTIGSNAFFGCILLTSVYIPSSVTTIGVIAFGNCTRITAFVVDASNNNYSSDADGLLFNKLKTILIQYPIGNTRTTYTIPVSVENIGDYSFVGCILSSVTIQDSVATIGNYAFQRSTNLVSIFIPDSVSSIGVYVFLTCSKLTAIVVDALNPIYSSDAYGVLFNKLKTYLIQYPIGNTRTTYTIPDSVQNIGDYSFKNCTSLTYVSIANFVATIGVGAFESCFSLNSVSIGNSVAIIGNTAFYGCNSLTSISIPSSVTSIENGAFQICTKLNLVYFLQTSSIPTIGTNTFLGISGSSVGKYYSGVADTSSIAPPVFYSISPINNTIPTLDSMSTFTRTSGTLEVFTYTDLSGNGNESVVNPPFVFLVPSVTTGLLSIGATQATATPWDASNNLINGSINAYWTPPDASFANAFTVVVQDAVGNVSSPNVQVPVILCFKKGTKILCENGIYIPIEELKIGDLVKTYKHGYQKIIMTAHSRVCYHIQNATNQLYTYLRESNPDLIEDLHLTGGHSLLLDTLTEEESANMKQITWAQDEFFVEDKYKLLAWLSRDLCVATEQDAEIYHFTLEPPENAKPSHVYGIYANGVLAESCSKGAIEEVLGK